MKIILFFLISGSLVASEGKKIEWFPLKSQGKFNKIPCELEEPKPFPVDFKKDPRPDKSKENTKISCRLLHYDF